jgi:hypothetical protein
LTTSNGFVTREVRREPTEAEMTRCEKGTSAGLVGEKGRGEEGREGGREGGDGWEIRKRSSQRKGYYSRQS